MAFKRSVFLYKQCKNIILSFLLEHNAGLVLDFRFFDINYFGPGCSVRNRSHTMFNNTTIHFQQKSNSHPTSEDVANNIHAFYFLTSVVLTVSSPVAVVGNALILATVWRRTFARTSFHILLSGLALTDFCTGLIVQPFYAGFYLSYSQKSVSEHDLPMVIVHIIFVSSGIYFVTVTMVTITLMSIERWLHMSRRFHLTSNRRRFTTILIMILLCPIPAIVVWLGGFEDNLFYALVLAEMSSCYLFTFFAHFKVYKIIRRHQHHIQTSNLSQNFGQPAIDLAKYKKSVASMVYILLLFSICYVPYITSISISFIFASTDDRKLLFARETSLVLTFLSSSLNPGLYLWRMRDLRNGLKQIFTS